MKKTPLIHYIYWVMAAWALVLSLAWIIGGNARFTVFSLLCLGFSLGMIAMFMATRIYKS